MSQLAHLPRPRHAAPALRSGALVALMGTDATERPRSGHELHHAVAVVESELAQAPQPTLAAEAIDAIFAVYLDQQGRLVPARLAEAHDVVGADDRLLHRARLLDELRAAAFADNTLRTYGAGVGAWRAWCQREGVPALPFSPMHVANHLIDYAFTFDEEHEAFLRDEDGQAIARVVVGSVELRLAALNKAAEFIGLPKPGENDGVRELMRGLRRTFMVRKKYQKRALTHDLLVRCLETTTGRTFEATRRRAAVLLRARTAVTAGQLANLEWVDIELAENHATIELRATHRHGHATTVTVPVHRTNSSLCPVQALRDLKAASAQLRSVFAHLDGTPLTRQALHLCVHKAAVGHGGWAAVPRLSDRDLVRLLEDRCPATPMQASRDRALLLVGFWGALRRSNLTALNWGDLTDAGEDGIEILLRWSKTDQEGVGDTVWAPYAGARKDVPCPATALRQWRAQLTSALGRPPHETEPVFVPVSSGGTPQLRSTGRLRRLTGESINEIVQQLVVAAGITSTPGRGERNPFGAHSLRRGWITEAAMAGIGIHEIMSVSKHKSVDNVMTYISMARAAKHNVSRRLLGSLLPAG